MIRKDITIRSNFIASILTFAASIILLYYSAVISRHLGLFILALLFFLMSISFYIPKVVLRVEDHFISIINDNENDNKKYRLNVNNLRYRVLSDMIVLKDNHTIVYNMKRSGKLIRELRKLGALEEKE